MHWFLTAIAQKISMVTTSSQGPNVSTPTADRPQVVLVHGLFMGRPAMLYLAKRLQREGFNVRCFAHNTITGSLQRNAGRLAAFVGKGAGPTILIGHSLGGLVSLQAAQALPTESLVGVVLLGSPYQGAQAGRKLHRLLGPRSAHVARALHEWADLATKPTVTVPVFTLSGTRSSGLGRVVCGFREPNDGTVTVAETQYPNAVSRVMAVSHTGMLFDRRVAEQVAAWVRPLGAGSTSSPSVEG
jgi:pimeloyl-ACP methyl ester carboxylesterase